MFFSLKDVRENKIKKTRIRLKGRSPLLHLSFFRSLFPAVKISGRVKLQFEMEGLRENPTAGKGFVRMEGQNIRLKRIFLETDLGPLHLPDIQWKEVDVIARLSEERVIFERFRLGVETDPFFLQMRGDTEVRFNRGHIRLGGYDIQLSAKTRNDFKLSLMDLFLAGTKTPVPGGWLYLARIMGSGTKPPDIEKISEF